MCFFYKESKSEKNLLIFYLGRGGGGVEGVPTVSEFVYKESKSETKKIKLLVFLGRGGGGGGGVRCRG